MNIEQFFKEKEAIKLTLEEKEKGREFLLGYVEHHNELIEEKGLFLIMVNRLYNVIRKITLGTTLYVRTLVATQYGNIEGIWKRKNNNR